MGHKFVELAFTETVRGVQDKLGSRDHYEKLDNLSYDRNHEFGESETVFISTRDSFYLGTVGETGWPYVQHRGGHTGFVNVLDTKTLAFADYQGNRQYVSQGNLQTENRVSMFFIDYARRVRLKILGRAQMVPIDDPRVAVLSHQVTEAVQSHAMVITLEAFDWNCPKYITERYTMADIQKSVQPLQQRIAELEARLETYEGES